MLHGLGGIGKTQLALNFALRNKHRFDSVFWLKGNTETDLRQSLCENAKRVRELSKYRGQTFNDPSAQQRAIEDFLDWLRNEDNQNWLLVFDNVDLDPTQEKDIERGAYDINQYFPGVDHGSLLITTRLFKMEQVGESSGVGIVDLDTSRRIYEKWNGSE